jgi:hypothetical protein
VKLTVRRGGGIAGIVARTELDAATLPRQDADEFAAKINQAGLKELEEPHSTRRLPDAQLYDISLEESGQQRSLHFTEESLPEGVRQLLGWVDGRAERVESIEM